MILQSKTGLCYPDGIEQRKDGKKYRIVGVRVELDMTIYTVRNDKGHFKEMTDKQLFSFFKNSQK